MKRITSHFKLKFVLFALLRVYNPMIPAPHPSCVFFTWPIHSFYHHLSPFSSVGYWLGGSSAVLLIHAWVVISPTTKRTSRSHHTAGLPRFPAMMCPCCEFITILNWGSSHGDSGKDTKRIQMAHHTYTDVLRSTA